MGLQDLLGLTGEVVKSLRGRDDVVWWLPSAVCSAESVKADARSSVETVALGALFDQHLTAHFPRPERVGRVAHSTDCVLFLP